MKLDKLKECILLDYKFGFLGEVYIEKDKMLECDIHIIDKYFSLKDPYYCNRNSLYYTTSLTSTFKCIDECMKDLNNIAKSNINFELKYYLMFTLVSHLMNSIGKLIGLVFSYKVLKYEYLDSLKSYLQDCSDYYVQIIFKEEITEFKNFDRNILNGLRNKLLLIDNVEVREYSEMDHPLILLKSFFVYEEYLQNIEMIVSPLQGSCLIPPIYISLLNYIFIKRNIIFEYLRFSQYDNSIFFDLTLEEQVKDLRKKYNKEYKILLIDDNVGTGVTIKKIKSALEVCFKNIETCVVECRWETKIYNKEYPAFNINDIDIITPLEYRHFRRFDEEINYIKANTEIHNNYFQNKFYELNYIYNHMELEEYINTSEIFNENKQRILKIISKYKEMELRIT